MNTDSESYLQERIFDRENGNILTYDPTFNPSETGFDTSDGSDLELLTPEGRLNELYMALQEMRAVEAQGPLSEDDAHIVVLLEAEIVVEEYAKKMVEIAGEHPVYTWHVGLLLAERLDELKRQGHPVDDEMYIEADELAEEIVRANPDKNADELTAVVKTMVELNNATAKIRHLTLAA